MTDEELKQLIAGNAQATQALSRDVTRLVETQQEATRERREAASEREELRGQLQALSRDVSQLVATQQEAAAERQQLREAIVRLTQVQEGIANLLATLDEDRPTILRKLTSIEKKVDRLLEGE